MSSPTNHAERINSDLKDDLDNAPIGMHWVGPDGIIIWANRTELEMLGYAAEEYIGQHIANFHVNQAVIDDILKRLTRREELHNCEAQLKCKDGSHRQVLISSNVRWEGEKFLHTRCFTTDNSLEKEALTAQARLAAIIESSDDAIISKNLDGIIISWNAAAERIFGYSAEEAINRHITMIIPPDRLDEETVIVRKLRAGERIDHYETIRHAKGGRNVHVSLTVSPIKNKEGKIIGASKIARDITERKNTEAQLREEQETLETLNRLAPAFASSLDLQSLMQMAVNESTRLTGAAFGAFLYNAVDENGKTSLICMFSGISEEKFSRMAQGMKPLFSPDARGEGTTRLDDVTSDPLPGMESPIVKSYLAVPVVSRSGEAVGSLFFGHSKAGIFTERDAHLVEGIAAQAAAGIDNALLYEQVKAGMKKAEAANRAKSEFLATMSHEIRTPMNAIVGLSSILARSEPLTSRQEEFVKTLQSSADSLLVLINDLLDISKIEARTVELEAVPFSVESLIQEIISMMAPRAKEKGLAFSSDSRSVHNRIFIGDPARLRQIINNLCSNALKFTEEGSVSISVSCDLADDPASVTFSVRDTGIGIPEDKHETIFQKFVQADSSINRKYGGTGLGLAISRTLANIMGGTISVESKIGEGSVFRLSLPLRLAPGKNFPENQGASETPTFKSAQKTSRKVLLIEDYEPNVIVAGAFLENLGYHYDVARNGPEAFEKVKSGRYLFALMDVQMPGLNGFEVTQLIRRYEQSSGCEKLPIIGVTAHALTGDRERCLDAGMDGYLAKPFSFEDLKTEFGKLEKVNQGRA
jgi:PAS domain S-box-containing protein